MRFPILFFIERTGWENNGYGNVLTQFRKFELFSRKRRLLANEQVFLIRRWILIVKIFLKFATNITRTVYQHETCCRVVIVKCNVFWRWPYTAEIFLKRNKLICGHTYFCLLCWFSVFQTKPHWVIHKFLHITKRPTYIHHLSLTH